MNSYYIPRNYKGEGRILYIFSIKALIYSAIGLGIGLVFYFILNLINLTMVGIVICVLFALIGFIVATFKVPEIKIFEITKKTGGEKIDDVVKRWFLFKRGKNKIYTYIKPVNSNNNKDEEEETKDE